MLDKDSVTEQCIQLRIIYQVKLTAKCSCTCTFNSLCFTYFLSCLITIETGGAGGGLFDEEEEEDLFAESKKVEPEKEATTPPAKKDNKKKVRYVKIVKNL